MAEANQEVETEEEIPLAGDVHELDHIPAINNPATPDDAINLWSKIPSKVTKKTAEHLRESPRCKCRTKLRFGKEEGELCSTCSRGIHRKVCTTLADADKAV